MAMLVITRGYSKTCSETAMTAMPVTCYHLRRLDVPRCPQVNKHLEAPAQGKCHIEIGKISHL